MINFSTKTNLYEHQNKAYNKLKKFTVGALFMDMGTGKTRTAIELIKLRKRKISKVIWICPNNVIKAIKEEFVKHTDLICCDTRTENIESSVYIFGYESLSGSTKMHFKFLNLVDENTFVIADESIKIKNHLSKRSQILNSINNKTKYRLILNGTPISKNEADLFSQFYFLSPKILGFYSFYTFAANHIIYDEKYPNKIDRILSPENIAEKIKPFVYQVKKEDCFDLPKKTYNTIYYDISITAKQYYNKVRDRILRDLEDEEKEFHIFRLFSHLQAIACGFSNFSFNNDIKSCDIRTKYFSTENKLNCLKDYLLGINNKVIIICKYDKEITDLSSRLIGNKFIYCGRRKDNIDNFLNTKDGILIGNISCLGYGLNLQECSNIIFYSSTFNYADRKQTEDRVYRNGQKNKVTITSILAENTIDEYVETNLLRKENTLKNLENKIDQIKDKRTFMKNIIKGFSEKETKCLKNSTQI